VKSSLFKLSWRLGLVGLTLVLLLSGGCALSNKGPVIVSLEVGDDSLYVSQSYSLRAIACDPDGDDLSYVWSATGGDISGDGPEVSWTAPDTPGTCQVGVMVVDNGGAETEMELSLEVVANTPPVIKSLSAKRPRANRGEFVVIECLAVDDDGDDLSYAWSATGGTFYGAGPVVAWEAPLELGTYTIRATVSDGKGAPALGQLTLEVAVNHSPVIESLTATDTVVFLGQSTDISCVASDPDGDVISYFWSATDGEIVGEGPNVIWDTPLDSCGDYVTITVSVVDTRGGETSAEITLRARSPG